MLASESERERENFGIKGKWRRCFWSWRWEFGVDEDALQFALKACARHARCMFRMNGQSFINLI